ncbi:hypothetical protein OKE77_09965, partial [Riemerella anatipestifer]|nr:hypothetical protein [Riemerella anatipestifer]
SAALRSFLWKLCFQEEILQNRLMGEVREATSPSGGVSRRADVAKGAKRISPHREKYLRRAG